MVDFLKTLKAYALKQFSKRMEQGVPTNQRSVLIVPIFSGEDNNVNKCNGSHEWRFKKLLLFNFFVMQIQMGE